MTPQTFLSQPQTVGIIGAGFNGGQPRGGVELGPARLVEHGLIDQLKELGWNVDFDEKFPDYELLRPQTPSVGKLKNAHFVSNVCQSVFTTVREHCEAGRLALTLGGDHSIAMGTVAGSASVHKGLGVIWVDAHADINTPETTSTGNLHGCPVAFLTGLAGQVQFFEWLKPCLPLHRIVYIGLRDVDGPEKKILKENNIKAFSMHEVDRYGIGKVVEMALDYLGRESPIHLSFDVDGLDPSVVPATGTPVRGGLSFREGHYICEAIHEIGTLVAVDLMEVNPALANDNLSLAQTIQVGCSLVRAALGETLL
ncbi:arginase [Polychytrium aggregatum]|uniref:arginase n=1 Tax=Polychytrium aggregatum TaxID=110093 RepID=UPI0022FE0299|nr:arginase [Polychytrium aggregatum]KAI9203938.1 arginase [Polychytrium aggregatum]